MKGWLKKYFLIFVFFIFSTYNSKHNEKGNSIFFPIKVILIENNIATDLIELKANLRPIKNKNLLLLSEKKILAIVNKHDFISNIQLKKKYPNTLKLTITEKKPVAVQIIDKNKFYITKKNEKINFTYLKIYENLPSIFGRYKNFNIFYNDLEKNNFKINIIKSFYYYEVGRWDIVLLNEKVIKFPEKNYVDLLPKINSMLNDNNFSRFKIFDFRIKGQLILQ
jgi:cell division septal protein FtsQ